MTHGNGKFTRHMRMRKANLFYGMHRKFTGCTDNFTGCTVDAGEIYWMHDCSECAHYTRTYLARRKQLVSKKKIHAS